MTNTLPASLDRRTTLPAAEGETAGGVGEQVRALRARHADKDNGALDIVLSRLAGDSGRLDEAELESLIELLESDAPRRGTQQTAHTASGRPDRARFFTDVRRLWLHSAARQRPNAILLIGVRPTSGESARLSLEDQRRFARMRDALASVFTRFTQVYAFDRDTLAMVLPGLNLRQAVAIAESTRRAVAQTAGRGAGDVLIQSGVVALHREDDPSAAVNLAIRCLEIAAESPVSKVVCETDPEARFAMRSRFTDRTAGARAR